MTEDKQPISWLTSNESDHCNDPLYSLDDIKKTYEVIELKGNGYLVLNKNDIFLNFAVMSFVSSNLDDSDTKVAIVFHGSGPSDNLRECRHTWWGKDGYIFYPNGPMIMDAFKHLAKYFDEMVED